MLKFNQLAEAWEASAIAYGMAVEKPGEANGYGGALMDCARELRAALAATPDDEPDAWKWETPTVEDLAEFDNPPEKVSTSGYLQTVRKDPTKLDWNDAPQAPAPQAVDDAFAALRALTEAVLTRADNDYLRRQLDAAVKVMAAHGCEPPVPWPDADFFVSRCAPSPTPTAPQEADALREALESVLSICNETSAARDLQPRMTEIRAIARAALAQHQPQQGEQQ